MKTFVLGCALSPLLLGPAILGDIAVASECRAAYTMIDAGWDHNCAILDTGSIVCWGENGDGQASPPPGHFSWISAGAQHSCAVRDDRSVVCWGSNRQGQSTAPVGEFLRVTAGTFHSCGLLVSGEVTCWGVIDGTPSESDFVAVSAGHLSACGLRGDGSITCWPEAATHLQPVPVGPFTFVSNDTVAGCAVRAADGALDCWSPGAPSPVPAGEFVAVSDSLFFACALGTDREVACWGLQISVPPGPFVQVSTGFFHACALRTDGTVACWGDDQSGQSSPPDLPDFDQDGVYDGCDNCPTVHNAGQEDDDGDQVGDACDNCTPRAGEGCSSTDPSACPSFNPRLGTLSSAPRMEFQTTTGGQLDDDADGFGNVCDGDFDQSLPVIGPMDLAFLRQALGRARSESDCRIGMTEVGPCSIFDLDQELPIINLADLARFRSMLGGSAGPSCERCPLECDGPRCPYFETADIEVPNYRAPLLPIERGPQLLPGGPGQRIEVRASLASDSGLPIQLGLFAALNGITMPLRSGAGIEDCLQAPPTCRVEATFGLDLDDFPGLIGQPLEVTLSGGEMTGRGHTLRGRAEMTVRARSFLPTE